MKFTHKKIGLLCLVALLSGAPAAMAAPLEADNGPVSVIATSVTVNGKELRVQNAEGSVLKIFNVTGAQVATYRIDSNDKTFVLTLQRGCYILNIGKFTRKISIR